MVYLPTFTINLGQMQVNIPYIEHLGLYVYIYIEDYTTRFHRSYKKTIIEDTNGSKYEQISKITCY